MTKTEITEIEKLWDNIPNKYGELSRKVQADNIDIIKIELTIKSLEQFKQIFNIK